MISLRHILRCALQLQRLSIHWTCKQAYLIIVTYFYKQIFTKNSHKSSRKVNIFTHTHTMDFSIEQDVGAPIYKISTRQRSNSCMPYGADKHAAFQATSKYAKIGLLKQKMHMSPQRDKHAAFQATLKYAEIGLLKREMHMSP